MSYRKEKKFRLTRSESKLLKFSLLEQGMEILYPKRNIKSCYFDTKNLLMFNQSEDGILPRKKIRYRWYDSNLLINKELKISSIEGRYKETFLVGNIDLSYLSQTKLYDNDYGFIYPSLKINYHREYYTFKKLRFTFDSNIEYEKLDSYIVNKSIDNDCVLEIKAANTINDDFLDAIISNKTERFSKYCRGIKSFIY